MRTYTTNDVITKVKNVLSRRATEPIYINGPVGAGYRTLLHELADANWQNGRLAVLGPFSITTAKIAELVELIWNDLQTQQFVTVDYPASQISNQRSLWELLRGNEFSGQRRSFLILVELVGSFHSQIKPLGDFFSELRAFYDLWNHGDIQVIYVVSGSWLHQEIEEYSHVESVSFPYSVTTNCVLWSRVEQAKMNNLTRKVWGEAASRIICDMIYEVTGGNLATAEFILAESCPKPISLPALWSATMSAARQSPVAEEILLSWQRLPRRSLVLMERLLITRCIADTHTIDRLREPLLSLGIAKEVDVNGQRYIRFFSPFVELCARLNLRRLGLQNSVLCNVNVDQLVPELDVVGAYAYQLVRDIENLVRGYVMLQIHIGQHVEITRLIGYDQAKELLDNDRNSGLAVDINPVISYFTTRDLASVVGQTTRDRNSDRWSAIAKSLRYLIPVRNAVMHNRVISFDDIDQLQQLREQVYSAISDSYNDSR